MTEARIELLKLILSIGLVAFWMVVQFLGWTIWWPIFFAAFLQWPWKAFLQRVPMTGHLVLSLFIHVLVLIAIVWTGNRYEANAQANPPGPLSILGFGSLYIATLIDQWRRNRKASLAAQP